ncbi:hypothetical protein D9M72_381290 [compost metagenome]
MAHLAADARLLEAAEGHGRVQQVVGVDPDGAGLQARDQAHHLLQVVGPDARRQPVGRVVGQPQHFVDLVKGRGDQHRAEDFLAHHPHVRTHIGDHRRLDEEALLTVRLAAADDAGALRPAAVDHVQYPALLSGGNQRVDLRGRIQARPDAE